MKEKSLKPLLVIVVLGFMTSFSLAQTLTVFAASSLTEAFQSLAKTFESEHEGVSIDFNFAGSSTLSTQIAQGAPADIFASANMQQMELVVGAGLAEAEPTLFAANRLVLITPSDSSLSSLEDLSQQGIRLVLAASEVPVGGYAREALERMNTAFGADFSKEVLANLVSEESNVRQVAAKVELGEADAAIVYATDAAILSQVKTINIPDEYNVLATYPIAIIKETKQLELAQAFLAFLLSDQGQELLKKQGFQTLP